MTRRLAILGVLLGCGGDEFHPPPLTGPPALASEQRISFSSTRDGNLEIYTMKSDGSDARRLTNDLAADHNADWSPDGTRLAFMGYRDGDYEIYIMNADGTGLRQLTHNSAHDGFPRWSPDGLQIMFTSLRGGNFEVYVM